VARCPRVTGARCRKSIISIFRSISGRTRRIAALVMSRRALGTLWRAYVIAILSLCRAMDCFAVFAMTARQKFCDLACGTHARNMRTNIAPYSYGLAARVRRIYNDVACSGGQGVRPSRRTLPLEATRPGLLGTPGLVYSSSLTAEPLRRTITLEKRNAGPRVIGPACRRSKRSEKLPDDQ